MATSFVDLNLVPEEGPGEVLSPQTKIVPLVYFQNRDHANALEDKVLHLKILSCTMGGSSRNATINNYATTGNKRMKTTQTVKSYNRFFLCADLSNPPHCCAIMTQNVQETTNLLRHLHGTTFVGKDFYLFEPNLTTQSIGKTLPIVNFKDRTLIPLKLTEESTRSTSSKMRLPTVPAETNYFVLKNQSIHLHRPTMPFDVSCSGMQCDRQKPRGECTCLHNGPDKAFVYSFDIEFPIPPKFGFGNSYTTSGFRSLQTTKIFFHNFDDYVSIFEIDDEMLAVKRTHRSKISDMVQYINNHGGWTIVGWFKLGEVADAANEKEKVVNTDVTVRLSYLYPSAGDELILSEAFSSLRIGYTPSAHNQRRQIQVDGNNNNHNNNVNANDDDDDDDESNDNGGDLV
jgi:hypothetical protein